MKKQRPSRPGLTPKCWTCLYFDVEQDNQGKTHAWCEADSDESVDVTGKMPMRCDKYVREQP